MTIKELIDNVSLLLQFFVPGYLGLKIFLWTISKKANENTLFIFSCVYSYILVALAHCLALLPFLRLIETNIYTITVAEVILSLILSLLFAKLLLTKKLEDVFAHYYSKTVNDSIWRDILDFEEGTNIKLILKDSDYFIVGAFLSIEENDDPWISLTRYIKLDKDSVVIEDHSNSQEDIFVIKMSNVYHVETFN